MWKKKETDGDLLGYRSTGNQDFIGEMEENYE